MLVVSDEIALLQSVQEAPETGFTCVGKVIGGYYADVQTRCQMFHVCTLGENGEHAGNVTR